MIREAGTDDLKEVGILLGAAFQRDPISTWLFPDRTRRAQVQPLFFETFSAIALETGGAIYLTESGTACTVWFPSVDEDDDEGDFMARFDMLTQEEADLFGTLAGQMAEHHPTRGTHRHLQFIGVHPDHQRSGVGGELLKMNLARLDELGLPAYLEASSTTSTSLYLRLGFEHIGTPFGPGTRAKMYPMWREPAG
ncbi:GNAT family N-acetyltransferase [Actinocrispum wychmicini]|uniref:Acetyltransferase (GNAT) family protein n=1 Tax=Actinocrispum wychmicini TaxID=1213861 RepID=A0A4R2JHZ3_9PSEU|nr:GNAT family N-acetyltransferase [Actinocrispum wychmicini]TCO56588.1 acetyltransferase (GNAT) family protein [Actinocrispum wychmicini]